MLYIRVDMNNRISTGHVMRCLAIADAARSLGEETTFILADNQALVLVRQRGHHAIVLYTPWDDKETELKVLKQVIWDHQISRLLIDSYQVTPAYLGELKKYTEVFYIDDINAFHYPVDVLICYANYWEKFRHSEHYENIKLYLGMQYTPLRLGFSNCGEKYIRPGVEHLLLLSGGSDPYDILDGILEQIHRERYRQISVICGIYYPKYNYLCEKYKKNENVHIYQGIPDLVRYMQEADMAISAGGITLYELCAVGTPAISYSFADNQLRNVEKFDKEGLISYAGDLRKDPVAERIAGYLEYYGQNPEVRRERSLRMQELVDGEGALRIAEALMDKE